MQLFQQRLAFAPFADEPVHASGQFKEFSAGLRELGGQRIIFWLLHGLINAKKTEFAYRRLKAFSAEYLRSEISSLAGLRRSGRGTQTLRANVNDHAFGGRAIMNGQPRPEARDAKCALNQQSCRCFLRSAFDMNSIPR